VTQDTARDAALRNDELLRRRGGAADIVTSPLRRRGAVATGQDDTRILIFATKERNDHAEPTNAELHEQLTEMTKRATAERPRASSPLARATRTRRAAGSTSEEASPTTRPSSRRTRAELRDQRQPQGAQGRRDQGAQRGDDRQAAAVARGAPIGAMKPPRNDEEAADRAAALEAAFAQDTTSSSFPTASARSASSRR
jgi:hypothetical protein